MTVLPTRTPRRTYDNFFPEVLPNGRTFRSSMLLRLNLLAYCSTDEIQVSYNHKYLNVLFFCIHVLHSLSHHSIHYHELSRALKLRSQGLRSPWPAVLSLKYLNVRTSWEIFFEISLTPKQILVFTTILQSLVSEHEFTRLVDRSVTPSFLPSLPSLGRKLLFFSLGWTKLLSARIRMTQFASVASTKSCSGLWITQPVILVP